MPKPNETVRRAAELDDYRWLVSDLARPWLEIAGAASNVFQLSNQLRRDLSPDRARIILEQSDLRKRAGVKFRRAAEMFFAKTALEQASDEHVAAYKGARFPKSANVADLCCGIGGDLLALAAQASAYGVERNLVVALLANANGNLVVHGSNLVQARAVNDQDVAACDCWHIDPDRRPTGQRSTRLEHHAPDAGAIRHWLTLNPNAAIKLAPAAEVPQTWQDNAELEWISRAGECRQLVAWHGALAQAAGRRRATVVGEQGTLVRTIIGSAESDVPVATSIGRFVFEPDAAVIAARLTGSLACEHGLSMLSANIAYLTGDQPASDPALAAFEVEDVLPLDIKSLKRHMHALGIGLVEVKKRGVDVDPASLQKQLRGPGDERRTLLLTPTSDGIRAILARRV